MIEINETKIKSIFRKIRIDREKGIEELYTKYNNLVYKIAFSILKNKEDAEDVTQTVFIKIHKLDEEKLPSNKELSWLYTVTKNEAITLIRKRNNDIDLDSIYEIEDKNNEVENIIDKEQFNKMVGKLKNQEKEIVNLKILTGLSFEEISKLVNEPISTVKWRYYKSISTLKIALSNFAMFIITAIIGVKTFVTTQKQEQTAETEHEIATTDAITKNEEDTTRFEEEMNSTISQDTAKHNNTTQTETVTVIKQPEQLNNNYLGISIIALSLIFLLIAIIFFIKYQLKVARKMSK